MSLTSSMEDYLKAILVLHQQHGYVRCVDVAELVRGEQAFGKPGSQGTHQNPVILSKNLTVHFP